MYFRAVENLGKWATPQIIDLIIFNKTKKFRGICLCAKISDFVQNANGKSGNSKPEHIPEKGRYPLRNGK